MIGQIDSEYIRTSYLRTFNRLWSFALFEGRPLLTKGRWINPLVFYHYGIEKRLPQLKKVRKPIFIVGIGRSGSTILGKILSMHRQIGFLNEPKVLWHCIYPKEDLNGNYSLNEGTGYYRLSDSDATSNIKRNAYRLYGAYLALSGNSRILDKYPEMVFRIPFIKTIFPDAKILFLARNGIDTAISIARYSQRYGKLVGNELQNWWGVNNRKWCLLVDQVIAKHSAFSDIMNNIRNLNSDIDKSIVEWIITMNEGLLMLKNMPEAIMPVKYEHLTTNPEIMIKEIFDFCELTYDLNAIAYSKKVLIPSSNRGSIKMQTFLKPLFRKTMDTLGYEYDGRY